MGTKISSMTTTGTAPTDSYLPLAYGGKNYKIPTGANIRAFIVFDGTGTIAASREYNIASLTDNDTGDYTVTFTDAVLNPVAVVSVLHTSHDVNPMDVSFYSISSSSIRIFTGTNSSGFFDVQGVNLVVF